MSETELGLEGYMRVLGVKKKGRSDWVERMAWATVWVCLEKHPKGETEG